MFLLLFFLGLRLKYIGNLKKSNVFKLMIKAYFFNNLLPAQIGGRYI